MYLEIITPEKTLFSQEIDAITLPGVDGEFELLNYHAALVSTLHNGSIKLPNTINLEDKVKELFKEAGNKWSLDIKGGVVECKDNKVIVLVD